MIAVDTNVLVRFLVADDERQAATVHALFRQLERDGERCFVSSTVILELLWVLESAYEYGRGDVLRALRAIIELPILKLEDETSVRGVIEEGAATRQGLADLLLAHVAQQHKCQYVLTFDRQASKHSLFRLLQ